LKIYIYLILKRLKDERIGFDSQLSALERSMTAKSRDYEELLLLSGDANHARDVAKGERDRVRIAYEEEKRQRSNDLEDRHNELALRRQTQDMIKQRAEKHADMRAEEESKASGYSGGGAEGEDSLKQAAALNTMTSNRIALERKENKTKIDIFEAAFRKIKDATGVSDVNEVISKIVSQEGTTENLMILTKENQAKIEHLGRVKEATRQRVEEVRDVTDNFKTNV
jgi:coiled-coil domain-containing protein 151